MRSKGRGTNAAAWFYSQPWFHASAQDSSQGACGPERAQKSDEAPKALNVSGQVLCACCGNGGSCQCALVWESVGVGSDSAYERVALRRALEALIEDSWFPFDDEKRLTLVEAEQLSKDEGPDAVQWTCIHCGDGGTNSDVAQHGLSGVGLGPCSVRNAAQLLASL